MEQNNYKKITKNHRVGIPEIDAQHRRLYNLIATLNEMCRHYDSAEHIYYSMAVKHTLYYTNYHIKFKENFMLECAYPAMEEHKRFHKIFFQNFLDQIRAFESRSHFSPEKLPIFLNDWLETHLIMDRDIGLYISNNPHRTVQSADLMYHLSLP